MHERRTAGLILTERSEVSLLAFNLLSHPPEIPMLVMAQEIGFSKTHAEQYVLWQEGNVTPNKTDCFKHQSGSGKCSGWPRPWILEPLTPGYINSLSLGSSSTKPGHPAQYLACLCTVL